MPKKQSRVKRAPTKQQLSRWQKEKKFQRLTLYAGMSVIGLVLVLLAVGFYSGEIRPLRKPALKVNDTVVKADYYVELLKLFSQSDNPVVRANTADYALNFIESNELIRQGAMKMGIVVTSEEVQESLAKSRLPVGRDVATDLITIDLYRGKMRDNMMVSVATQAEQVHLLLMLLDNREKADEVREKINAGAEFASMAKEFSRDFGSKDKGGDIGWLPREAMDKYVADAVFTLEPGKLSEPLQQEGTANHYLFKVLERKKDMELSSEIRDRIISQKFSDWVAGLRKESTIEVYLDEKDKLKALELARKK